MPNWKSSKNKKDKAKRDVNRRPFLQGPKRLLAALDWSFRTIATLIPEIQLSSEEPRIYTSAFTQIVLSDGRVQMDPSNLDSKICGMFISNVSEKFNFFLIKRNNTKIFWKLPKSLANTVIQLSDLWLSINVRQKDLIKLVFWLPTQ